MNAEIKRHIDAARQVLVGVVPNPTSQIDQITNALIYKFMDDMDQLSIKNGGEPSFFVDELEKYSWTRIMDSRIGNQERMNLYIEGFNKISESESIPPLFRNILKSAFLLYRSPEVLGLFLKEISYFDYSHPEELGNAYEYLLSIMSSQGDAGQFRTPRHIIDFIVEVVNPTAEDKILDPACGTAGFLISAYKNILKQHDGKEDPEKKEKPLTPDERKKIHNNFEGYDIDPGMVRIAQVNMYLHQFINPKIYQYDTLSMDERWNDKFDVILANPPFMSPKGGIKPHNKFSIQSSRSEVLFVDYIMNHLKPKGRAGVIVPEGVIFQSGTAYKQLRKRLVDEGYLWAVVSLPAGVFQPYSGVKTSILFLDKDLASQSDSIVFMKISNDGYSLGAQRREISQNDLPTASMLLNSYKRNIKSNNLPKTDELEPISKNTISIFVPKTKIKDLGDYYLSGDRYKEINELGNQKSPLVQLNEIAEVFNGKSFSRNIFRDSGTLKVIKVKDYDEESVYFDKDDKGWVNEEVNPDKLLKQGDTLIINAAHSATHVAGKIGYCKNEPPIKSVTSGEVMVIRPKGQILPRLLNALIKSENIRFELRHKVKGIHLYPKDVQTIKIPLPPIEVQKEIVEEMESYQKIIDGAKQVVENWRPKFDIKSEWKTEEIENLCTLVRGSSPRPKGDVRYYGGTIPRLMVSDVTRDGMYVTPQTDYLTEEGAKLSRPMNRGEVVMAVSGNPGLPSILSTDACIHDGFVGFRNLSNKILPEYFYFVLLYQKESNSSLSVGAVFKNLTTDQIKKFEIPLPSLEIQRQIVEKIEAERKSVDGNKKLIEIYEQKIKDRIAKIYN